LTLVATKGTAAAINAAGVTCGVVNKVTEGRPHIVDMIKNEQIGHGRQHGGRAPQRDCRLAPDPYLRLAGPRSPPTPPLQVLRPQ